VVRGAIVLAAVLALIAPAAATASSRPGVDVLARSNLTFNSVLVNARIDPNNAETTYFVQFGLTKLYGSETPHASAGAGANPKRVSIPVTGLTPATRYHYRVVAINKDGITQSADHTFKTANQPLGVTLAANPATILPGGGSQLTGQLTGTNSANRDVVLQANQYPFAGFVNVGNRIVTDAQGNFSFSVLTIPFNTQFRVALAQRPEVVSPVVFVGAMMSTTTAVKTVKRFRHSKKVRFKGAITPAPAQHSVSVQKLRDGVWTTIATVGSVSVNRDGSRATYSKKVRIGRSGKFRVIAEDALGKYSIGAGRVISIKAPK
jgi:hypothetical protein